MQYTIFGLGNPGEKYEKTRHNIGKMAFDAFSLNRADDDSVVYIHSTEYMNNSGRAVKNFVPNQEYAEKLIVIHDDIDLPLGTVRISFGRGSGGHNGVQSIIDTLGTKEFIRVRIGVAKKNIFGKIRKPSGEKAVHSFLLSPLSKAELEKISIVIKEKVVPVLETIIKEGREKAMNLAASK